MFDLLNGHVLDELGIAFSDGRLHFGRDDVDAFANDLHVFLLVGIVC